MNWWIERGDNTARITDPYFGYNDPGGALSGWRTVKLLRGLVRHPNPGVRVPACRELLLRGWGQDECREMLSDSDKAMGGEIAEGLLQLKQLDALWWWPRYTGREERRLLTAASNPELRTEICRLYEREYPGDRDTGCPADRPPPATIVTENGDVPLTGAWPR